MPADHSSDLSRRIAAGRQAILAQTARFHAQFGRATSHWKHDGTRVTDADLAISEAMVAALRGEFPADDFFSEELAVAGGPIPCRGEWAWVLDPIDGTNNYALGVPLTAISLGLLHRGEPAYGFLYDLGRRALLHGGAGRGLWENDAPVAALGGPQAAPERILGLHSPIDARYLPLVTAVLRRYKLRAFGSGALHLAYAALGRIDVCLDFTVKVWDIAAAAALCSESGVVLHFFNESPFPLQQFDLKMKPLHYTAGHPAAVAEIVALVEQTRGSP